MGPGPPPARASADCRGCRAASATQHGGAPRSPLRLLPPARPAVTSRGSEPAPRAEGLLQAFYCEREDCAPPVQRVVSLQRGAPGPASSTRKPWGTWLSRPASRFRPRRSPAGSRWRTSPPPPSTRGCGLDFDYDFDANTVRIRCAEAGLDAPPIGLYELEKETVANALMGDKLLGWPSTGSRALRVSGVPPVQGADGVRVPD